MLPSLTPFTCWTPENEQLQGCHSPWAVFQILSVIHWEYQVVLLSEVLCEMLQNDLGSEDQTPIQKDLLTLLVNLPSC